MSRDGGGYGALAVTAALAVTLSLPAAHALAPRGQTSALFAGAPELVVDRGELAVLVGAARPDGSPARVEDIRLLLDGDDIGKATAQDSLLEYASEHPKWAPPIAVGIVYLWAKGTPDTVVEGIEALLKHLPSRTNVYPTPYGQGYRPVVTRVTAGRAAGGDLRDSPAIDGDQYKLIEAVRFNAQKLAGDGAAIKHLVILTDGRDYQAGPDSRTFAALGDDLRKKRLRVSVVTFRPSGDTGEWVTGIRELVETARARHLSVERVGDLPLIVESLTESLVGLQRVRFALPWLRRARGGTPRVGIKATVDGVTTTVQDGTVAIIGRSQLFVLSLIGLGVVGVVAGGVWLSRNRGKRGGRALQALLDELQESVRLGIAPDQIVIDLSQQFPDTVDQLGQLELGKLSPERYRLLRTRAGQRLVREVQKLLAQSQREPAIDDEMAQILNSAVAEGAKPREVAHRLQAKVGGDRWSALSRATSTDLKKSLERAGINFALLQSDRAMGFAAEVQQELRVRTKTVAIGWLVRASGPGRRGETVRIPPAGGALGRGEMEIALPQDAALAAHHADIVEQNGQFVIRPVGGVVLVEGNPIGADHTLVDGQTIDVGKGRYVFKCAVGR